MNQSIQVGPLALPLGPLMLAAAAILGLWIGKRLGRRRGLDAEPALMGMLLIGLLAARVAFVWTWRAAYLDQPWSVFDIRDGGWNATMGVAAAALFAVVTARRRPALGQALTGGGLTTLAMWTAATVWLWSADAARPPMPPLPLTASSGEATDLRSYIGKPTVVNLWATWCPPCRREMPLLQQAQAAHPELNFVFVNQGEDLQDVQQYLQQQKLPLKNVLLDPALRAGAAFDKRGLPSTLFYDAQGRLVSSRIGELSAATLAERLQQIQSSPSTPHSP